jgi:hypothetical protein
MRSRAFTIGLVAGAIGVTVTLFLAILGALVGVPLIVIGVFIPPRLYGAAGTLIGAGVGLVLLFGRVAITCQPPWCSGPSPDPFIAAGVVSTLAGLALLVLGLVRDRR